MIVRIRCKNEPAVLLLADKTCIELSESEFTLPDLKVGSLLILLGLHVLASKFKVLSVIRLAR